MSYRVDIPTLSANEVYTLTFEYEGTETIQLIVGDLSLETTDRRVVFTTTSPVNYIESNVNLTNLNMYEGYYESDDFGGEYTQESYIEGKSLINLINVTDSDFPKQTNFYDFTINKDISDNKYYTLIVDVSDTSGGFDYGIINKTGNNFTYLSDTITTDGKYIVYRTFADASQTIRFRGKTSNSPITINSLMLLEGDYSDGNIGHFTGIGCVKSPKIVSYPKYPNIAPNCKRDLSNVTPTAYRSDDNSYIKITNTARWVGVSFGYYPQDFGYGMGDIFCLEFDVLDYKGTGTISNGNTGMMTLVSGEYLNSTGRVCYIDKIGHYKEYFICNGNSENGRVCLITVHLNTGTGGINTLIEIDNLKIYKIDDINDTNEYEEGEVTTPDDLELYDLYHGTKIEKQDKLDLTTGIVTRNVCKWKLNDYLSSNLSYWGFREWSKKGETTNEYVRIHVGALSMPSGRPTVARGWSEVYRLYFDYWDNDYGASYLYDGKTYFYATSGGVVFMCSKAQILSWTGVESYELLTTQIIHDWFRTGDFTMMNALSEPTTEQISINPLKSYRNGSIITSSQQLAPTLKTTLPISNKFTTTNLTSGATYNIYFDGTATKLDAGGTIITNPVSPCEVECGGTTLTIEGTDIQNVRVIETTNKNEVGSVCGTTDVELSKIKTKCGIHNIFDDYFQGSHNTQWAKDYNCTSTRDNTTVKIVGKGSLNYAGYSLVESLPFGTYKLHYKVKVSTIGDKYKVALSSNPNSTPQDAYVPVTDVTSTALVEEQTFVFYKKHITNMLFYTYTNGQEIEYYDISLIKLSDEDITGTDTSSINYSQTISDLEQPIKLRSLGTTYDSYNPVTGELTKRIGVSETDGSYSVLSSPIVIPPKYKMLQDNNIMPNSFPQQMNSGYVDFLPTQLLPNTTYTIFLDATTAFGQLECGLLYNADWYDGIKHFTVGVNRFIYTTGNDVSGYYSNTSHRGFRIRGQGSIINNLIMVEGEYSLDFYNPINVPHLYTNGQVKVYSDSEVYPTTILNGQSTNNYEVNELNTSNNYTIRYEGECESINLANKSNTQGTNRIVKSGATSGNLTFVNNSGDIDNVLLVQNDVREQEINHFNGLQTVEVSRMLIQNQRNMFCYKDISVPDGGRIMSVTPIPVQPGETLYCVVYNSVRYSSLIEYDSDMKQLRNTEINVGYGDNGNAVKLTENTYYIKVVTGASFENKVMISREGFLPLELCENIYQGAYIDLPQPVQLNSLPDGTCDTYNPITGEYVQRVGYFVLDDTFASCWRIVKTKDGKPVAQRDLSTQAPHYNTLVKDYSFPDALYDYQTGTKAIANIPLVYSIDHTSLNVVTPSLYGDTYFGNHFIRIALPFTPNDLDQWNYSYTQVNDWLRENPIHIVYKRTEPITTQLTPINIPTFEGGILQFITTDGKVFPMIEYSMPTLNRYDTSSWETGAVYTQRNMTEAYFNESTTPMTPTETMTLTTDHISSGSIILNDNGNGLIVLKGNYTGRDIPYFTGMRSVEAIEVETTPSPDQPLFGKGGRK